MKILAIIGVGVLCAWWLAGVLREGIQIRRLKRRELAERNDAIRQRVEAVCHAQITHDIDLLVERLAFEAARVESEQEAAGTTAPPFPRPRLAPPRVH